MAIRVGLVQLSSGGVKEDNVERALALANTAVRGGARLVALPENFHLRVGGDERARRLEAAESIPGPLSKILSDFALEKAIWLLAGSYGEEADGDRIYNTSLLYGPDGAIRARYRKIHLFDVNISGGVQSRESETVSPGTEVVSVDTDFGHVGLSICYDVRFPDIYRIHAERGAFMSFVPSNFALHTGKDHWETLLRARAIENGMFIVAPAQIGGVPGSFTAYGRSMVVDPWGTVLACASDREGIITVDLEPDLALKVRSSLPSLYHRRPDAYGSDPTATTSIIPAE